MWHTVRCLHLVATWTNYSKALQRRGDSTTEINGIVPAGAPPQLALVTYITQSSLLVARQFVTLLDFEITVAWKVAQGKISQRLRRGGMQTISSTILRFQETIWCRNATLASLEYVYQTAAINVYCLSPPSESPSLNIKAGGY